MSINRGHFAKLSVLALLTLAAADALADPATGSIPSVVGADPGQLDPIRTNSQTSPVITQTQISPIQIANAISPQAVAGQNPVVDTSAIEEAICWVLYFSRGWFGALLIAVTGVGTIVGAAMGNFKRAIDCLVIALGLWLIEPVADAFFNSNLRAGTTAFRPTQDCKAMNIQLPTAAERYQGNTGTPG